ncbi:unnamed protein product [Commensalibacter communis]|uniref:Uncharacterized protein n=1 Tax=Commensalibacter communis TaxID=2972786 RepID=A0A9W4TTD7_9PROT|nr:hypothetical protein [Commensalibacter communis]CAI3941818.1 unnamed protein product [Commensalibacter communis]CAI3944811.1 unnamed protein product [Commensalibacter communis]CAI3959022.1 unnamed protein product [Commensalibacter communis]CAI3961028.1 unnamed protein product [Commensalibacter communis]
MTANNVKDSELTDEKTTQTKAQDKNDTKKKINDQRSGNGTNNQELEPDGELGNTTSIPRESTTSDKDILLTIGCKFPNGVVICVNNQSILLKGIQDMPNRSALRNYGHVGYTQIKQSLWREFLQSRQKWAPLENGSIFVVGENNGG